MQLQIDKNKNKDDYLIAITDKQRRAELSQIFIVFLAFFRIYYHLIFVAGKWLC